MIGLIGAVVYLYMYMEQSVFHPVAVKYIPSRLARYIGKTGSKEKCEGDYIFIEGFTTCVLIYTDFQFMVKYICGW